jgi:hypothetical protein
MRGAETSEYLPPFNTFRAAFGETRELAEAPAHIAEEDDAAHVASLPARLRSFLTMNGAALRAVTN